MKHVKLFESFVNEGKKPTVEVSVRHAKEAGEAFRDAYSKMGKMTSTNTFQFKNAEDAEEFAEYLVDYIEIPEDEIEGHNLDESVEGSINEGKLTTKDFDKVVKAVEKSKQRATVLLNTKWDEIEVIIGFNAPDSITNTIWSHTDKLSFNNKIAISGDSSTLSRREYDEIAKVNGGHKDY